jgi:hypothetical protein
MQTLKTTSDLVKEILKSDKQARNSDSYLYFKVINHIAEQRGINLHGLSVPMFLLNGADMGFVGFETVRRTRQKLQQHHPELAACEAVEGFRAENEKVFRDFARGEA